MSEVTISREKLVQLWGILNSLATAKTTAKGAYAIAKNKKLVQAEVEAIEETRKNQEIPEGIQEFEEKRIELCRELADRDENDQPTVKQNAFVITENKADFEEKLAVLQEEYKEAIDAREKLTDDFNALMKEEISLTLHDIRLADLPDNITADQIESLEDIILE